MTHPTSIFVRLRRALWFRLMLMQRGMTLGVRVIAVNSAGEVLLVRHGYTPGWHLPGGGVDHHETMEQAALRELEEETGHRATTTPRLLGISYNRRMWKGDHVAVYVLDGAEKVREVSPTYEIKEIGFFAPDALQDGTTKGTRARIAEWQTGRAVSHYWND